MCLSHRATAGTSRAVGCPTSMSNMEASLLPGLHPMRTVVIKQHGDTKPVDANDAIEDCVEKSARDGGAFTREFPTTVGESPERLRKESKMQKKGKPPRKSAHDGSLPSGANKTADTVNEGGIQSFGIHSQSTHPPKSLCRQE